MLLVSLHMRWSVSRNGIFILKWRYYGPKGDILNYLETLISWFIILLYPIKGYIFIGFKKYIYNGGVRFH